MSDSSTLYSICHTNDGDTAIGIVDGPLIAIGEHDLVLLAKIVDLALWDVTRRAELARVKREMLSAKRRDPYCRCHQSLECVGAEAATEEGP